MSPESPTTAAPLKRGNPGARACPTEVKHTDKNPAKILIQNETGFTDATRAWFRKRPMYRTVADLCGIRESTLREFGCPDTVIKNVQEVLAPYGLQLKPEKEQEKT